MFTGIIRHTGVVEEIINDEENRHFIIQSPLTSLLHPDESVCHNGVCLTIVKCLGKSYQVTAVLETLNRTNLRDWVIGGLINLEQAMKLSDRLDGHLVQGHIDTMAVCTAIIDQGGSYQLIFSLDTHHKGLVIEKGSICVNGVSLTCYDVTENKFTVSIIPYTWDHTNLKKLKVGDKVNIEFDLIGKYVLAANQYTIS
jgi:riboflavin synthase